MIKNTITRYGSVAKLFHWVVFVLIVAMLVVGKYMIGLDNSPSKFEIYGIHKAIGVIILLLVSLRLVWRLVNIVPHHAEHLNFMFVWAANLTHLALYAAMFAMPITGWMMSSSAGFKVSVFGLFELPDLVSPNKANLELFHELHEQIANIFIVLIIVHILGALFHHFVRKDTTLRRMLPFVKLR